MRATELMSVLAGEIETCANIPFMGQVLHRTIIHTKTIISCESNFCGHDDTCVSEGAGSCKTIYGYAAGPDNMWDDRRYVLFSLSAFELKRFRLFVLKQRSTKSLLTSHGWCGRTCGNALNVDVRVFLYGYMRAHIFVEVYASKCAVRVCMYVCMYMQV
jgi:hypothetical protein